MGLGEKSDKELAEIIGKMRQTRREVKSNIRKMTVQLWKLQEVEKRLKRRQNQVAMTRGKKKGAKCPAKRLEKTTYGDRYQCLAKRADISSWLLEDFYKARCSACRFTPERAMARRVFLELAGESKPKWTLG